MENSRRQLGRINHVIATSCDLIVPFFFFLALKETVWAYNLPSRFHCHSVNALELTKGADTKCPSCLGTCKKKAGCTGFGKSLAGQSVRSLNVYHLSVFSCVECKSSYR